MSVGRFCPFKMSAMKEYPSCEFGKCMWYKDGQCAASVFVDVFQEYVRSRSKEDEHETD